MCLDVTDLFEIYQNKCVPINVYLKYEAKVFVTKSDSSCDCVVGLISLTQAESCEKGR